MNVADRAREGIAAAEGKILAEKPMAEAVDTEHFVRLAAWAAAREDEALARLRALGLNGALHDASVIAEMHEQRGRATAMRQIATLRDIIKGRLTSWQQEIERNQKILERVGEEWPSSG